jgi:hypothetical protein
MGEPQAAIDFKKICQSLEENADERSAAFWYQVRTQSKAGDTTESRKGGVKKNPGK